MTLFTFAVSFLSSVISSMGLGGGGILILYLTLFKDTEQLKAQGINLIFFIPSAITAIILHSKNKLIEWNRTLFIVLGGVFGVIAGTFLASFLSSDILSKLFAVFLFAIGIRELFDKNTEIKQ